MKKNKKNNDYQRNATDSLWLNGKKEEEKKQILENRMNLCHAVYTHRLPIF